MPLKNIRTTSRWIRPLRLKWLRRIWTGKLFIGQWAHGTYGHQRRDTETGSWPPLSMNMEWLVLQSISDMGDTGWNISMWRSARLTWSHSYKLAKGSRCLQWWEQPPYAWKHTPCPMSLPRTLSQGLEKQGQYGTTGKTESDNWTNFWNLIGTWSREHDIEWLHHNPYHASASRKIEL